MLDPKNIAILESLKLKPSVEIEEDPIDDYRSITFMNMSGDISVTWDSQNDEKIKALIKAKMAQGYSFFTMRKVVIESIQIKRKVGAKGIDKINNLVIDDATFEKMVKGVDDKDLADALNIGTARLAKRRGDRKVMDGAKRITNVDDVVNARQSVAIRPIVGG